MATISCAICDIKVEGVSPLRKYCSEMCRELARGVDCAGCGKRVCKSRTSAEVQYCRDCIRDGKRHGRSGADGHGASGYRGGCRCDQCRRGHRERMAAYGKTAKAERGISLSALYKRRRNGYPDDSLICVECDLPVGSSRFSAKSEPRHAECRQNYSIAPSVRRLVFKRDSLICHLCGGECDPSAGVYDDAYPTLDHIVCRSRGGGHEPENLATAHRICNVRRGDTPLDEWLEAANGHAPRGTAIPA